MSTPKDKKSANSRFFLSRSALSLFRAFFLRDPALFFSFALASAKARNRKSAKKARVPSSDDMTCF
jgi:hypothetical protein